MNKNQNIIDENANTLHPTQKSHLNFLVFVENYKKYIIAEIDKELSILETHTFNMFSLYNLEIHTMLSTYMQGGKMWRALLCLYFLRLYTDENTFEMHFTEFVSLATSLEFLQTFLLIHDDVMDNDSIRRNNPSIHEQFFQYLKKQNSIVKNEVVSDVIKENNTRILDDTYIETTLMHDAQSLAICLGDVIYAHVFTMISKYSYIEDLVRFYSSCVCNVGIGQFKDVLWTAFNKNSNSNLMSIDSNDILKMYTQKTGMYTCVLPAILGLLSATQYNLDLNLESEKNLIIQWGEKLGVVFQVQDDILGLCGDSSKSGKPQGSDLVEKKNTYINAVMIEHAKKKGNLTMLNILQNDISDVEIAQVLNYFTQEGLDITVNDFLYTQINEINTYIEHMSMNDIEKKNLYDFSHYMIVREK